MSGVVILSTLRSCEVRVQNVGREGHPKKSWNSMTSPRSRWHGAYKVQKRRST